VSTTETSTPSPKDATTDTHVSNSPKSVRSQASPPAPDRQISVIVLSKNEPDLAVSLELLRPQCETLGAQCIVVDASEGRLEYIHEAHPWTTWVDFSGPFWRSSTIPHQRNAGCRAATGNIIAFCDSGAEPDSNWLASITGPLLSGSFTLACGPVYAKGVGVYSVINDVADGEVVQSAPTANMAFVKAVFDQVDGFDERLFYGSDHDFVWRCADAQHLCYQVRGAGMLMDFGSPSLTVRRSWRYGRGWARLYGLHPERHGWMLKQSPERVAYPAWVLLGPLFLLAGRWRKLRWAPFAWLGLLALPLVRNRKYPSPRAVVAEHIIAGASVLIETFRRIIGEMDPVVFLPDDETPYLRHLADALTTQGTPVSFWRGPTKSATLNILLGPMWVILLAWRGVRIVHIHWTYEFSRSSGALGGRLARWWFEVFLSVAHTSGLKVVWTVHNVLPHEPVFDDDISARRVLATRADAIIALTPHSAQEVSELFRATKVTVISHGPLEIPTSTAGRDSARSALDVGPRPCFTFFGNIRPYKGLETLIAASELLGHNVAVRITGRGDPTYVAKLTTLVDAVNSSGADVKFDPRRQSDAELADLLSASDVCVFPFNRVDNSSSVLLALATGVPVIIPNLVSLQHIDNPGVLRYDAANPVRALSNAMTTAANLSHSERETIGLAAREWALQFNWATIAEETAAVYAQTIRGN
jgi:glycosyltransferase involved in cell wall biosynthesis